MILNTEDRQGSHLLLVSHGHSNISHMVGSRPKSSISTIRVYRITTERTVRPQRAAVILKRTATGAELYSVFLLKQTEHGSTSDEDEEAEVLAKLHSNLTGLQSGSAQR